MNVSRILLMALITGLWTWTVPAVADTYLIVHPSNPTRSLTRKEAVDLYMGRHRAFPNGDYALLFDLPRDHPVRQQFYKGLTGLDPAQVNSYWSRLMFTGQTLPPQPLPNEATVQEMVRRNPSALGFVGQEPVDKSLRVVLIVKDHEAP